MADGTPKTRYKRAFFGGFLIFITAVGMASAIPALKGLQHVFDAGFDIAFVGAMAAFGVDAVGETIVRVLSLKNGEKDNGGQ